MRNDEGSARAISTLDDFVSLSEALTGVHPLDRQLASDYLARASSNPDVGGVLTDLIATFKDITAKGGGADVVNTAIGNRIMADGRLGPAAQQIIYLWYISAFFVLDPTDPAKLRGQWQYGPPQHYPRGLVWSVIKAHAPMAPGGDVGYWANPPP